MKWNTLGRFLKLCKTLTVHVLSLVKNFCASCSILTNDKTILFLFWTLLKLIPATKNSVSLVRQDNLKVHLLQLWLTSLLNELPLNIWMCILAHVFTILTSIIIISYSLVYLYSLFFVVNNKLLLFIIVCILNYVTRCSIVGTQ